jgi:hypothetical protein
LWVSMKVVCAPQPTFASPPLDAVSRQPGTCRRTFRHLKLQQARLGWCIQPCQSPRQASTTRQVRPRATLLGSRHLVSSSFARQAMRPPFRQSTSPRTLTLPLPLVTKRVYGQGKPFSFSLLFGSDPLNRSVQPDGVGMPDGRPGLSRELLVLVRAGQINRTKCTKWHVTRRRVLLIPRLTLPQEEEGGASRANDVVKVQGCGWV